MMAMLPPLSDAPQGTSAQASGQDAADSAARGSAVLCGVRSLAWSREGHELWLGPACVKVRGGGVGVGGSSYHSYHFAAVSMLKGCARGGLHTSRCGGEASRLVLQGPGRLLLVQQRPSGLAPALAPPALGVPMRVVGPLGSERKKLFTCRHLQVSSEPAFTHSDHFECFQSYGGLTLGFVSRAGVTPNTFGPVPSV